METLSDAIRQRDSQRIPALTPTSKNWGSWNVLGLPGCGSEKVFELVLGRQREQGGLVIELDFRDFKNRSTTTLVASLLTSLKEEGLAIREVSSAEPISDLLTCLREAVTQEKDKETPLLIGVSNFDAMLAFPEVEETQHLLNLWEGLGDRSEYHTHFLLASNRDLAEICREVYYSPFYKIFETHWLRIRDVHQDLLTPAMREYYPHWDNSLVMQVASLSGGYPEHVEVIARYSDLSPEQMKRESLDALSTMFGEWLNCLMPSERAVLELICANRPLSKEHQVDRYRLVLKGVLTEVPDGVRVTSPLFKSYVNAQLGPTQEDQEIYIRHWGNLPDLHVQFFRSLFKGFSYIEWEELQPPTPENATVYRITGEDRAGREHRPCILKIDREERLREELQNAREARELLGPVVPNVLATAEIKTLMGIKYELATADNHSFAMMQFKDYFAVEDQTPKNLEDLITRVFTEALFPLYREQKLLSRRFRRYYFLPKADRGEFGDIEDIAKHSRFYDPAKDVLLVPGWATPLPNPGVFLRQNANAPDSAYNFLFDTNRLLGISRAHGDLNPRNLLIDRSGQFHIIDFSEMKDAEKGTRFLDLVRLEAETKFKLAQVTEATLVDMIVSEELLVGASSLFELERLRLFPTVPHTCKMVAVAYALRKAARTIAGESQKETEIDFEYKLGLLAQTLRLALFKEYITPVQLEFAVISAALLADHLMKSAN